MFIALAMATAVELPTHSHRPSLATMSTPRRTPAPLPLALLPLAPSLPSSPSQLLSTEGDAEEQQLAEAALDTASGGGGVRRRAAAGWGSGTSRISGGEMTPTEPATAAAR